MRKCIYCNRDINDGIIISESDIIPESLTNKKIKLRSVCEKEHNNKFGETFESDIINSFARERNQLGITNKNNKIPSYKVKVKRGELIFEKKIARKRDFFNEKGLISGKYNSQEFKLGKVNLLSKMKNFNMEEVELVNLVDARFKEIHSIDLGIFYSQSMLKLVSKIAYEWFCKKNEIYEYRVDSSEVVNFILYDTGMPVEVFDSVRFNNEIFKETYVGAHSLGIFSDESGSYVFYSFWGLVNYKIKVSNIHINMHNETDIYVIRSDGSDYYCKARNMHLIKAGEAKSVISKITDDILKRYKILMTHKLVTVRSLKSSIIEIDEILKLKTSDERKDKLLGYREDNMLAAVYILNAFSKQRHKLYKCYTFNQIVRIVFDKEEFISFNKEEWSKDFETLFNQGILESNLKSGIEIFSQYI